ncbi:periplasmic sensory protein associated with the TorRS two-component regulatory system [Vibrio tapetis subsp. tapetis]|uniref:Periplasmic sensory protein associated with the TorRS two-component regulatory system n=2 Tax=Vibrio tapetis TaxID=52443 RepID=A0A2N8ZIE8_9VIBR|nr:periplasmic sensory protein associated with the TorRS two-component regulatory system [Vibrio tapetis subsp. tapetis]
MITSSMPMPKIKMRNKDCFSRLNSLISTTFFLIISGTQVSSAYASEKLCAIYPHLKDSYWLSVNYGMVDEAKKLGLELKVLESGGYPNIEKQQQQLIECKDWGASAIILGTVSPNSYQGDLREMVGDIPIFATVNHLESSRENSISIKGHVGADWYWMGYKTGKFLAKRHPKGSGEVKIAWLPGPRYRGGTKPVANGFLDAIKDTDVSIVLSLWADNDKELQRNLVQNVMEHEDIDYIVGSAVAIEAAISELRNSGKQEQIKLLSVYLSHGVYRGIRRNKVLFAPSDKMVLQGRKSVQQAAYYLADSNEFESDYQPTIEALTPNSYPRKVIDESLSPPEFRPIYNVTLSD